MERWNSDDDDRGYQLRVANRLWGQKEFPFLADYLTLTRQNYWAELGLVDYKGQAEAAREEINAWVEQQTAEKIKDLLPQGVIDRMTRLVLTNAIYFKGDWASQFKKDQTHDANFMVSSAQKVKVPLMHQKQSYPFVQDASLQVLELPYKGNDLSMLVLLPKETEGLADLESSLSASKIAELRAKLRSRPVDVYLPKFKLDASFSLTETLQGLGMKLPFTETADFSGMDGRRDLHISAVSIRLSWKLTKRARRQRPQPGVVMRVHGQASISKPPVIFRADHPFVFAICDKRDGSILFLGRVADPVGE